MTHPLLNTYERTLVAAKQAITNMTQAASMLKNLAGTDEMLEHVERLTRMVKELNSDLPGTCWREVVERDVWGDGDDFPWAYSCRGDEPSYIFAPTEERARELLQDVIDEWARRDVFAHGHPDDELKTVFYDVYFGRADLGRDSMVRVVVCSHPPTPPCCGDHHTWEEVSTSYTGYGSRSKSKCTCCGLLTTTEPHAQHPLTGQRGYYVVSYYREGAQ